MTRKTTEINLPRALQGARLSTLHGIEELRPTLLTSPEWVAAAKALEHIAANRPEPADYPSLEEEMVRYVAALVTNGKPFDTDAAEAHAARVETRATAGTAIQTGFDRVTLLYAEQMEAAADALRQTFFDDLTDRAQSVVAEARENARYLTMSAEDAVSAKEAEEWRRAQELPARFRSIHAAAEALRGRFAPSGLGVTGSAELLFIANPVEVMGPEKHDEWAYYSRHALTDDDLRRGFRPADAPWPISNSFILSTDVWLTYLATEPAAHVWAPSPAQYAEAAAELNARKRDLFRRMTAASSSRTVGL